MLEAGILCGRLVGKSMGPHFDKHVVILRMFLFCLCFQLRIFAQIRCAVPQLMNKICLLSMDNNDVFLLGKKNENYVLIAV